MTDSANFKAHSGKYVLGVNANATSSLSIPILSQPENTPSPIFVFPRDTTQVLSTLGGTYTFNSYSPALVNVPAQNRGGASFGTSNPSLSLSINPADTLYTNGSITTRVHYYTMSGTCYFNITTAGNYSFNLSLFTNASTSGYAPTTHTNSIQVYLYDDQGNNVSAQGVSQVGFNSASLPYSVFLCPGIYKASYSASELLSDNNGNAVITNTYGWSCTNSSSPTYLTPAKVNGCVYTRAVPGSTTMMNPVFNVPAYKKMLFSGWVHESCGNPSAGIACKLNSFVNDQVQLSFTGSPTVISFNPTGPIIDGWQRYDSIFTVPAGATAATLKLVNSGSSPVYFDDIRIQPFNANVKSYIYDPINLRLIAELDANNYATFYEYDEEGTLVRTKIETREGIKTVTESRSALQKAIQ
jgi:hypothetical protein